MSCIISREQLFFANSRGEDTYTKDIKTKLEKTADSVYVPISLDIVTLIQFVFYSHIA